MSDKNFEHYHEDLPEERDAYHIVEGGNLYLINFAVNKTELRPQHRVIIDRKVVPFICDAIRDLGPGAYTLHVYGSASATGKHEHNMDLAAGRAYNSALYAIHGFESKQKSDPRLQGSTITPSETVLGDELSSQEATLLHLRSGQIERKQAHFRAAMFRFTAGIQLPAKGAVFFIREVYRFKFKKVEEPLPVAVAKLKKNTISWIVKFISGWGLHKILDDFLKICDSEVPGLGMGLTHMVTIMIPTDVDYCFDIKDYRGVTARYRFEGIEHKDSWEFTEFLEALSEVKGVIGGVIKVLKVAGKGSAAAEEVAKAKEAYEKVARAFYFWLRHHAGDEVADTVKRLVDLANPLASDWDDLTIPSSDWSPFMFYDRSAKHSVRRCEGEARRTSVDIGFKSAVDLDFAGPVPNSWTDYNAEAKIISPFRWSNSLWAQRQATGRLVLM